MSTFCYESELKKLDRERQGIVRDFFQHKWCPKLGAVWDNILQSDAFPFLPPEDCKARADKEKKTRS